MSFDLSNFVVDANTFAMALCVYLIIRFEGTLRQQSQILTRLQTSIDKLCDYVYLAINGRRGRNGQA